MFLRQLVLLMLPLLSLQLSVAEAKPCTQTSLPLRFIQGSPPPFLEVTTAMTIQGKKIPMIVDTGDSQSGLMLSERVLKQIKVRYTGKQICFKMVSGQYCEPEFIVPDIKLGSFSVKNVSGIKMPESWQGVIGLSHHHATEASLNGAIGLPVLSQFNLLLDPVNAKMVLIKQDAEVQHYDLQQWISIPCNDHLVTQLKMNGQPVTLVWDTGAMPSGISQSLAHHFTQIHCPKNYPNSSDENCMRVKTQEIMTSNNERLPNTWFNVEDIPAYAAFDGFIGSDFYAKHPVYFDFKQHSIYVNYTGENQ